MVGQTTLSVRKTFSSSGWHKLNKLISAHVGVKREQNWA